MDPWDIITICCPEVLIRCPSVICSTHIVPRSHHGSVKSFDRWSRQEGERNIWLLAWSTAAQFACVRKGPWSNKEWSLNMFSVSQASTCADLNSPLSLLCPRASYSHSKVFPPEFLEKFTHIWICATEHLGIRIRASLTANTNHRERLPDSWIDSGMAENQSVLVKLFLNIVSPLRRQCLQNTCSVKKHLLTYCPNIADS